MEQSFQHSGRNELRAPVRAAMIQAGEPLHVYGRAFGEPTGFAEIWLTMSRNGHISPSRTTRHSPRPARNLSLDGGEIRAIRHDEEALALAARFPNLADGALLAGVIIA